MSNFRPMTYAEFKDAKAANHVGLIVKCSCCGEPFSPNNVKSVPGWKETQISGMCESCFDSLFDDAGEGNDPYMLSAIPLDIITPIEKVAKALKLDVANMLVGTILVPEQCLELYMNNGEEDVWYQVTVTKVEEYGEDNDS